MAGPASSRGPPDWPQPTSPTSTTSGVRGRNKRGINGRFYRTPKGMSPCSCDAGGDSCETCVSARGTFTSTRAEATACNDGDPSLGSLPAVGEAGGVVVDG